MSGSSVLARFTESTLFRYVLVGGIGFLFELLVLFVALNAFDVSTTLAVTLSFWLGLVFSFVFQKVFAFGNRDRRPIALGVQGLAYAALVLVNYGFTVGFAAVAAPVIGVYLSRAVSLLITTGWNFFAYRYVIFNERTTAGSPALTQLLRRAVRTVAGVPHSTVALVLATALVAPLLVLASLANLVADDYSYFTNIDAAGSPMAYAAEHYLTHNGRFSQALLVALSYSVLGVHAVKVVPVLLLVLIILLLGWVIRMVLPFERSPWQSALALSGTVVAIALYSMPSFFDTYLWLTSSTVYLGSIASLLVNLALTIVIVRSGSPRPVLLSVAMLLMVAGQTFSEPTALFAIAAWGVWGLSSLIRRNWRSLGLAAATTAALIAGFLANFLSPGTRSRQTEVGADLDLRSALSGVLGNYGQLVNTIAPWAVLALILSAALAAGNIEVNRLSPSRWRGQLFALILCFVGTTFFVFLVSQVGSDYYPLRNYALPVFGATASLCGVFIAGFLWARRIPAARGAQLLAAGAFVACAAVLVPFAAQHIALQTQGLSLRDSVITHRAAAVSDQLAQGQRDGVRVAAAPVLTRSEAFDIQNPGSEQAEWVIGPFKHRSGIPQESDIEIIATPPSYCLPASNAVKPEFVCR